MPDTGAFRTGPCSPWIDGSDITSQPGCAKVTAETAAQIAEAVTNILYRMTAQQFTGECGPVTVRPISRPSDQDTRAFAGMFLGGSWSTSWGTCYAFGLGSESDAASHYQCENPPSIDLGAFPVTSIVSVKIDGEVIPENEYQLQDFRTLTRMRVTDQTPPTDRWGWPTCQTYDLPDTEEGTFSVTYMYGTPPPVDGVLAAKAFGRELGLYMIGSPNKLPDRVSTVTRQNVTMTVLDMEDYIAQGRTGIAPVDYFIKTINPGNQAKPSVVWSPDIGRARRAPR